MLTALREVPISRYCEISGVDEALVRAATRRIAAASSVATFEDLGVQMNRHSTLVSYLEKLVWLLTGNLANPGGQYAMTGIGNMLRMSRSELHPTAAPVSPVVGAKAYGLSIFGAHAAACVAGVLPEFDLTHARRAGGAAGKAVVFARQNVVAGDTRAWLRGDAAGAAATIRDIPHPGERIAGRPAGLHRVRRRPRLGRVPRRAGPGRRARVRGPRRVGAVRRPSARAARTVLKQL